MSSMDSTVHATALDWPTLHLHGQDHLRAHWESLPAAMRPAFEAQLQQLHLKQLRQLFERAKQPAVATEPIEPPAVYSLADAANQSQRHLALKEIGEQALRDGQVAVLMVAGGQGSRLGHDGPKGTYPIGPISGCSLFQIHAERVLSLCRRYEQDIPLLIMTSTENDQETRAYWQQEDYFGLSAKQVRFFLQGMMPALDAESGRILLAEPGRLALSPNGHGGVLQALSDEHLLDALTQQGIRHLFYFQVDNPLVQVADPAFLGGHMQASAEMSVKVVRKVDPNERIGLVVQRSGRAAVIEYTELTAEMARQKDERGGLRWWAGNTAIHCFDLPFLRRLAESESMLPFHQAYKVMPCLNEHGVVCKPEKPNALKFEMFIFDALPLAQRTFIMECAREEEFEPLKNGTGEYSPSTVREAITERSARWLRQSGVDVPKNVSGKCPFPIEISPLFANDLEELRQRWPKEQTAVQGPLWLKGEDQQMEF